MKIRDIDTILINSDKVRGVMPHCIHGVMPPMTMECPITRNICNEFDVTCLPWENDNGRLWILG